MKLQKLDIEIITGPVKDDRTDPHHNPDHLCLECISNLGLTAFWGSDGNLKNIERISKEISKSLPFKVKCMGYYDDLKNNPKAQKRGHKVWIPESSNIRDEDILR